MARSAVDEPAAVVRSRQLGEGLKDFGNLHSRHPKSSFLTLCVSQNYSYSTGNS